MVFTHSDVEFVDGSNNVRALLLRVEAVVVVFTVNEFKDGSQLVHENSIHFVARLGQLIDRLIKAACRRAVRAKDVVDAAAAGAPTEVGGGDVSRLWVRISNSVERRCRVAEILHCF